jgi:outer membrane protein insertion porin family
MGGIDPLSTANPDSQELVADLRVEGAQSLAEDKVLAVVRSRRGEPLNKGILNEDLKRIWKMGLFQDVSLDAAPSPEGKGVVLTFHVTERPLVQEVRFFGNKEVGDGTLKEKAAIEPKQTYDQNKVAAAVLAIEEHYKSKNYYAAQVSVDTKKGTEPGQVIVNFRISEGNKMKIEEIVITGNKVFSASRIKGAMKETREAGWFTGGAYDVDKVFEDYQSVLKLYGREGYAKAKIDNVSLEEWGEKGKDVVRRSTEFDEANKRIVLRFSVQEGVKFRLNPAVTITGNTLFTTAELLAKIDSTGDKVFNADKWEADLQRVAATYHEKGYIYAAVTPQYTWDEAAGEVRVALAVSEGGKAYIEDIRIRGNDVTKDKVIRRVISLKPGDAFDLEAVNKDKMKIYNLGFFENVAIDTQPGSEMDKLILIYDVSPERKTGTLSLGAGYSSVEGLVGFLQVSQNNLFGNGQAVSAQWDFGNRKTSYSLSFTEPWLFDRPISFGVDVYQTSRTQEYNSQGFNQNSTGGSLRLGYTLSDLWKVFNTYRYQSDETRDVDPRLVGIFPGIENISSITPSLVRDSRDNIFDATRGSYNILSTTLAGGFLGGDRHFVKPVFDSRLHFMTPAIFGQRWLNSFVLGLHGRVGRAMAFDGGGPPLRTGDNGVPVSERFFMGGTDTVRGYGERSLGEVANTGGLFTILTNIEYGFKPAPPVKIRAFYDSGNAWSDIGAVDWNDPFLYPSFGVGMLFTIPTSVIQIRLDYGWPLVETGQGMGGKLHFNIGNIF